MTRAKGPYFMEVHVTSSSPDWSGSASRAHGVHRERDRGGPIPRKFIEETIHRINELMERNVGAKTYLDLSREDNRESMELVSRIGDIADAMSRCRSRNLPDEERGLYAFAETTTDGEVAFFKSYFVWFRSLSTKDAE